MINNFLKSCSTFSEKRNTACLLSHSIVRGVKEGELTEAQRQEAQGSQGRTGKKEKFWLSELHIPATPEELVGIL